MAKREYLSQFYADDKDIYDVLDSATQRMSTKRILELARERGIILSEDDGREALVEYVSKLPFDWRQLERLLEISETAERPEKTASSILSTSISKDELRNIADAIKTTREGPEKEIYQITATPAGLRIDVQYADLDTSRTRINQRRTKHLTITLEATKDGFRARHEANSRADAIVEDIATRIVEVTQDPAHGRSTLELTGIREPSKRTDFFIRLMKGIPDYSVTNVKTVKVDRMADAPAASDDVDDESPSEEDVAALSMVRSVLLHGSELLKTEEYKSLAEKGMFISKATWRVDPKEKKGNAYEFEAEFADGPNGKGFRYNIKGVYERKATKDGSIGELKKTRENVKASDRTGLFELLEEAARSAHADVSGRAQDQFERAVAQRSRSRRP